MTQDQLLVFTSGNLRIGIQTGYVERAVMACEVSPLPNAPPVVIGVMDFHGDIVPVFDVQARFGVGKSRVRASDIFIICDTPKRKVVLAVDSLTGLQEYVADSVIQAVDILPGLPYVEGVVRIADDLVLVHDLSRFLNLEEEQILSEALKRPVL